MKPPILEEAQPIGCVFFYLVCYFDNSALESKTLSPRQGDMQDQKNKLAVIRYCHIFIRPHLNCLTFMRKLKRKKEIL